MSGCQLSTVIFNAFERFNQVAFPIVLRVRQAVKDVIAKIHTVAKRAFDFIFQRKSENIYLENKVITDTGSSSSLSVSPLKDSSNKTLPVSPKKITPRNETFLDFVTEINSVDPETVIVLSDGYAYSINIDLPWLKEKLYKTLAISPYTFAKFTTEDQKIFMEKAAQFKSDLEAEASVEETAPAESSNVVLDVIPMLEELALVLSKGVRGQTTYDKLKAAGYLETFTKISESENLVLFCEIIPGTTLKESLLILANRPSVTVGNAIRTMLSNYRLTL